MWIYDGENRLINTDMLLSIRASKEDGISSILFRRRTGNTEEDFCEFFLCAYPNYEKSKEVVADIAEAMESGCEIYCIERWKKEDEGKIQKAQQEKASVQDTGKTVSAVHGAR